VSGWFGPVVAIQGEGARAYDFWAGLKSHIAQPEGFLIVGGWLIGTWMFDILPNSYFSFEGGIQWPLVFAGLLIQDGIQWLLHWAEHRVHTTIYQYSHKPHHRFVNPVLFDAFDGSLTDTTLMILVPLTITTQVIHCNVWTYMTIGSLYSSWLCLIHSEYVHPWDTLFRFAGFGTPADHHVHHKTFIWNYGHLFTYWDRLSGCYKAPTAVRTFNKSL
jgi:lathosterol oxidase